MKIKKDDTVIVIAGKDRGKKGKVRFAYPKSGRIIVEGVNFIKKHARATGRVAQAGIIEREEPINISNVMLVCGKCNRAIRVSYKYLDAGKKVRVCSACGEVID